MPSGQRNSYGATEVSKANEIANAERLREFGPVAIEKPVVSEPAPNEEDEALLAALMTEDASDRDMFYRFAKSMITVALRSMDRATEAGRVAGRLGRRNPITTGVMGIGDGSGVIQDRVRFVEAIMARFAKRYRATGSVDQDNFESPTGV